MSDSQEKQRDTMVSVRDLNKVFRDFWRRPKVRAVNGISFDIRRGEVFGLLGPNGSGKSTTIKIILGLLHATSGGVTVLGASPRSVRVKSRIGYLPEESYLYDYLTSEETLDFYGKLFNLDPRQRERRMKDLFELVGLTHARKRLVGEFSKGMARRIGLAQALINDPDLVILDEPTAGLDPLGCRQVKDLILTLARRGKTVLLSSHLLADVEDVCDNIAILFNGRIQAAGDISGLLEQKNRYRITLPEMPEEQLQRILAELRKDMAGEPEVDHPRRNLEQFFLEVIARARGADGTDSGARPTSGVSGYLAREEPSTPAGSGGPGRPVEPAGSAAGTKPER